MMIKWKMCKTSTASTISKTIIKPVVLYIQQVLLLDITLDKYKVVSSCHM